MAARSVPMLLKEASEVKEALDQIAKELPGGVSGKAVGALIQALDEAVSRVDALKAERTKAVNAKKEAAKALNGLLVKARMAIKIEFGPDSSEYEMAGGTRASERKKPVRKPKA
jgi:hypothetical protein